MKNDEIDTLLYNYQSIEFNKENVRKYLNFLCYFGFDFAKEIVEHVALNYLCKNDLIGPV